MSARTFQKYQKNQKKQENSNRRNQAKQEINQALEARAFDFAEDARKINNLYTRYAAESNADGFAEAVLDYANTSPQLVGYIPELRKIIEGHKRQSDNAACAPLTPDQAESIEPAKIVKIEASVYDREQKRLEAMNREFQRLLRKTS